MRIQQLCVHEHKLSRQLGRYGSFDLPAFLAPKGERELDRAWSGAILGGREGGRWTAKCKRRVVLPVLAYYSGRSLHGRPVPWVVDNLCCAPWEITDKPP